MIANRLVAARKGATAIEYALLIGMIGLFAMEAIQLTGVGVRGTMDNVGEAMPAGGAIGAMEPVS